MNVDNSCPKLLPLPTGPLSTTSPFPDPTYHYWPTDSQGQELQLFTELWFDLFITSGFALYPIGKKSARCCKNLHLLITWFLRLPTGMLDSQTFSFWSQVCH